MIKIYYILNCIDFFRKNPKIDGGSYDVVGITEGKLYTACGINKRTFQPEDFNNSVDHFKAAHTRAQGELKVIYV